MVVDAANGAWDSIFESNLGGFKIGTDIFPVAQTIGFLLHELIPLRIASTQPDWRRDASSAEKDLVYTPDLRYSVEIKTSSHKNQVFGNRSFGLENPGRGKKAKDGFYLAVNFQSWADAGGERPQITVIRFGWLDHTDWVAQTAQSGQNSTLPAEVYNTQLLTLFKR